MGAISVFLQQYVSSTIIGASIYFKWKKHV